MEEPIKHLISIFIGLLCGLLVLTIVTFGITVNHARNVLYTVIDYVEIAGPNMDVINDYAEETNTTINVTPTDDEGIYNNGDMQRYRISVTFHHSFAWIRFNPSEGFTIEGVTRAVQY